MFNSRQLGACFPLHPASSGGGKSTHFNWGCATRWRPACWAWQEEPNSINIQSSGPLRWGQWPKLTMFFADNFWTDKDEAVIQTPSCSSHRDASKYVWFDPERSSSEFDLRTRDLRVKFGQNRSKCISFKASWRAEQNESTHKTVFFFCKKLFLKTSVISSDLTQKV